MRNGVLVIGLLVTGAADADPSSSGSPEQGSSSGVYAEPSLLVGGGRVGALVRVHSTIGYRFEHTPTAQRFGAGAFLDVGSEEIGDAVSFGIDVDYDRRVTSSGLWRFGGRAGVGYATQEHVWAFAGGARARYRYLTFGADVVYARRSETRPAAVGLFAVVGLGQRPGRIVVTVQAVAIAVLFATFAAG